MQKVIPSLEDEFKEYQFSIDNLKNLLVTK